MLYGRSGADREQLTEEVGSKLTEQLRRWQQENDGDTRQRIVVGMADILMRLADHDEMSREEFVRRHRMQEDRSAHQPDEQAL